MSTLKSILGNNPLTEQEVMAALHLHSWAEIEAESKEAGLYPRRSGRTTRMLVQCILYISRTGQPVRIYGHSYAASRILRATAKVYCEECKLDPALVLYPLCILAGSSQHIFKDHHYCV